MKITIDTKEDSHEEIKKVIKMLSSLVGDAPVYTNTSSNIFDDNTPSDSSQDSSTEAAGSALASLFGNTNTPTQEPQEEPKESEDDEPKTIIEY